MKPKNFIIKTLAEYKRYAVTADGVSPRGVPGYGDGLVGIDSDEHDEDAHITESAKMRVLMHEKRWRKMEGVRDEAFLPTEIGDVSRADIVIVSWGSNRGVVEEALEIVKRDDLAGLHFHQVYPLPEKAKKLFARAKPAQGGSASGGKKIIVLENNFSGQFTNLLKLEYGVKITDTILKYDGDPFSVEEVVGKLRQM